MTEALAQTVLQMGGTNDQPLRSYAVTRYAFYKLRTLYRRYARQLRKFCYAFYTSAVTQYTWRRFRPMWSDVVIVVPSADIMHFLPRLLKYFYINKTYRHMFTVNRQKISKTRNAWQSLAYSPLGAIVSPPSEYL